MNREFARATGQLWKYRVWLALSALVGVITLAVFWPGNPLHLPWGPSRLAYFGVAIPWMAWWAGALSCPQCRARPVWYLWTHARRPEDGEARTATASQCPACGLKPEVARTTVGASPEPGSPRRLRALAAYLGLLLVFEGIALVEFPRLWPSTVLGWVVFAVAAPVALLVLMALGELAGERLSRASLRISKADFSFARILFGVLVYGALLAGLIWLSAVFTGRSMFK